MDARPVAVKFCVRSAWDSGSNGTDGTAGCLVWLTASVGVNTVHALEPTEVAGEGVVEARDPND